MHDNFFSMTTIQWTLSLILDQHTPVLLSIGSRPLNAEQSRPPLAPVAFRYCVGEKRHLKYSTILHGFPVSAETFNSKVSLSEYGCISISFDEQDCLARCTLDQRSRISNRLIEVCIPESMQLLTHALTTAWFHHPPVALEIALAPVRRQENADEHLDRQMADTQTSRVHSSHPIFPPSHGPQQRVGAIGMTLAF